MSRSRGGLSERFRHWRNPCLQQKSAFSGFPPPWDVGQRRSYEDAPKGYGHGRNLRSAPQRAG
jgi:hypothetical protein